MIDPHPTARRYPRTLHGPDGAFPRDPDYACAITITRARKGHRWLLLATLAIGAAVVFYTL